MRTRAFLVAVALAMLAGLEGKGLPAIAYYKQFQEASRLNGSQH